MEKHIEEHRNLFKEVSNKVKKWCPKGCGKKISRFRWFNEHKIEYICVKCETVFDKEMKEITP